MQMFVQPGGFYLRLERAELEYVDVMLVQPGGFYLRFERAELMLCCSG
jgi:hypothetical protein